MASTSSLSERYEAGIERTVNGATVIAVDVDVIDGDDSGRVYLNKLFLRTENGEVLAARILYAEERMALERYVGPRDRHVAASPRRETDWVEINARDYWGRS